MKLTIDGRCIIENLICAHSLLERMKGLLGKKQLPENTALLIDPCPSIHTFGMRFTIDAVFLDSEDRVVRVVKSIKPHRVALGGRSARKVIEMESGSSSIDLFAQGVRVELLSG